MSRWAMTDKKWFVLCAILTILQLLFIVVTVIIDYVNIYYNYVKVIITDVCDKLLSCTVPFTVIMIVLLTVDDVTISIFFFITFSSSRTNSTKLHYKPYLQLLN